MLDRTLLTALVSFLANDPYIAVRIVVVVAGIVIAALQKLIWNVSAFDYFSRFLASNPYFSTTFGIVGVGAGLAALQQTWSLSHGFYTSYMSSSLQVPDTDASFLWLVQWIFAQQVKNPYHITVTTEEGQNVLRSNGFQNRSQGGGPSSETKFIFIPREGVHHFKFKEKLISISRINNTKENKTQGASECALHLATKGRDTEIFKEILHEARKFAMAKKKGMMAVYHIEHGQWNYGAVSRHKRTIASVILAEGVAEFLIADIQKFVDYSTWYYDRGVPYRRGYLLYGPPGTGKTSTICALAGHFNLNICILNLSDKYLTDDVFSRLLSQAPPDSLLLLEDVDAAFCSREQIDDSNKNIACGTSQLTFSGFLNALDGVSSGEGRIMFLTTNYADRLDPALLRPGRIDIKQQIGYASKCQLERMYRRFYPEESGGNAARFADEACNVSSKLTMAQVQGLFLMYMDEPQKVLQNVKRLGFGPEMNNHESESQNVLIK